MREAVGEVAGLDVLHLQCHIGFDSISLARRGARVTGADFSPASLAKARDLAARAGVEVEFVEADATALPRELHGRFDLVYATMGVICWIEDLGAWMRSVHAALRPGGRLVLVEIHPLYNMIGAREPLDARLPLRRRRPAPLRGAGLLRERGARTSPSRPRSSTPTRSARSVTAAVGAGPARRRAARAPRHGLRPARERAWHREDGRAAAGCASSGERLPVLLHACWRRGARR